MPIKIKNVQKLKKKCYHLSHRGVVVVRHITGHQLLEEMINRSVSQTLIKPFKAVITHI